MEKAKSWSRRRSWSWFRSERIGWSELCRRRWRWRGFVEREQAGKEGEEGRKVSSSSSDAKRNGGKRGKTAHLRRNFLLILMIHLVRPSTSALLSILLRHVHLLVPLPLGSSPPLPSVPASSNLLHLNFLIHLLFVTILHVASLLSSGVRQFDVVRRATRGSGRNERRSSGSVGVGRSSAVRGGREGVGGGRVGLRPGSGDRLRALKDRAALKEKE